MTQHTPYWNDGATPDEQHPRAGWYVLVAQDEAPQVFGPFTTEAHAAHFENYVTKQDHD
ncbi:MAG: hypothetical protein ACK5IB_11710 [Qingshengfaniella sp.]